MADQYRHPYDDGRGWSDRAGDEVRSWFGDDDARARRDVDGQSDDYPDRPRGASDRSWTDRGSWGSRYERDPRARSGSDQFQPHRAEEDSRGRGSSSTARQWRGSRDEWGAGQSPGWGDRGGGARPWDEASGYGRTAGDDWRARSINTGARMAGYARQDSYAGRGPKGYRRSDERIREDVCDRLADDPRVDASDVTVEVKDAEITLSGTVPDREQKRRAEDCIENASGVRNVINNLRVGPSSSQPGDGGVLGLTGARQDETGRTITPTPS